MPVVFSRLHIFEYKFNNMEDVNSLLHFENSTFGINTSPAVTLTFDLLILKPN